MKELLVFFSLIFLMSCSYQDHPSDESVVNSELEYYLQEFEYQAKIRNLDIRLEELELETAIQHIDEDNVAGLCHYSSQYPNRITIDKDFWDGASALMREMVVFHELGHCVLARGHREDANVDGACLSIMQSGNGPCRLLYNSENRTYYLNELFALVGN